MGDIAVLARSNPKVMQVAGTLQSRGIMASTEQPGLLNKPEIVLALACLRRLNDEWDTVATAEIVALADCEDPELWLTDRLAWLEKKAKIGDFADLVREVRNLAHPARYRKDHPRKRVTARYLRRQFDLVEICRDWLVAHNNKALREALKATE